MTYNSNLHMFPEQCVKYLKEKFHLGELNIRELMYVMKRIGIKTFKVHINGSVYDVFLRRDVNGVQDFEFINTLVQHRKEKRIKDEWSKEPITDYTPEMSNMKNASDDLLKNDDIYFENENRKFMRQNNKKLYESIMASVAKEVKKALNENITEEYNTKFLVDLCSQSCILDCIYSYIMHEVCGMAVKSKSLWSTREEMNNFLKNDIRQWFYDNLNEHINGSISLYIDAPLLDKENNKTKKGIAYFIQKFSDFKQKGEIWKASYDQELIDFINNNKQKINQYLKFGAKYIKDFTKNWVFEDDIIKYKEKHKNDNKYYDFLMDNLFMGAYDIDEEHIFKKLERIVKNFTKNANSIIVETSTNDYWENPEFIENEDVMDEINDLDIEKDYDWQVEDVFSLKVIGNVMYMTSDTGGYSYGGDYFDAKVIKK